jgi:imidazole glycerol-phosphate synthase subunit HisH
VSRTAGIVDYGLGNLRSVAGAVERLDWSPVVTSDPDELARCDRLLLPGVGAFGDGMRNLRERGLVGPLTALAMDERKPVLGLCLGAQLLVSESEEFGRHEGLGWIDGRVRRIEPDDGLRVPHVGWNELRQTGESILFDGVADGALFYYVHTYVIEPAERSVVKGETDYGRALAAVIELGNVYGTQFHPEKSQLDGLTLLGNFLESA